MVDYQKCIDMFNDFDFGRCCRFAFLFFMLLLGWNPPGSAAPDANNENLNSLLDLDLEQLLDIRVYSRELFGIHHSHPAGEWMLGYSYMHMSMEGNRDGTSRLSTSDVFDQGYRVAPTDMDMDMHMFGLMYGVTDRITAMVMLPRKELTMRHVTMAGMNFSTESSGLGDLSVAGVYSLFSRPRHQMDLTVGLYFPTGATDQTDATPMGPDQKLPYPMQLGSGTYDPLVGFTYTGTTDLWSGGAHLSHLFRLGENDEGYTLGERTLFDAWIVRQWKSRYSASVRIHGETWGNIDGADPELNPAMVPTADPARRAGTRLDFKLGGNLYIYDGLLSGTRVNVELGFPFYQSLDGPQLETDYTIAAAIQWIF